MNGQSVYLKRRFPISLSGWLIIREVIRTLPRFGMKAESPVRLSETIFAMLRIAISAHLVQTHAPELSSHSITASIVS
jgi:hypothetical protein